MNTLIRHALAALALLTTAALGQGGLTPAGAPAPSMKSLLELWNKLITLETSSGDVLGAVAALKDDPRTPIISAPFTISQSGSYYLAGNLTVVSGDAITITAADVSLDLRGFTISSTANPASGNGVLINNNRRNIRIANGNVKGTTTRSTGTFTPGGFSNGIRCTSGAARNITVTDIHVSGVAQDGIHLASDVTPGVIIERCAASVCGGYGLVAGVVRTSGAVETGATAIDGSIVSDSFGNSVGTFNGYSGIYGREVINSHGVGNAGPGITGTNVTNSFGSSTTSIGISSTGNVANSFGQSGSGAAGIDCSGTVSYSRGQRNGGVAIDAAIAIGCTVSGTGTVSSPSKHLGTP